MDMTLTIGPDVAFDTEPVPQASNINLPGEERPSDSPFVESVWRCHSDSGGAFISTAETHWEIVVTKFQGNNLLTIRGPETRPSVAHCPPDAEFMGIVFKLGTFMPRFPAVMLMDRNDLDLPQAGSHSFWLDSAAWEFPGFENADQFVNRLVREGLLVEDPVIDVALREKPVALSPRTIQRRFLQATGLTYNIIYQIQRARYATSLLKRGAAILEAVEQAGYADQPHLTRALKRFIGQTPGEISDRSIDKPMSLLFKTPPF